MSAGHDYSDIGTRVDGAAADFAKAALGIPENARVHTLDVESAALFVLVERDGMAKVNATIPKRDAAEMLRKIAAIWDQEWKSEAVADMKRLRDTKRNGAGA